MILADQKEIPSHIIEDELDSIRYSSQAPVCPPVRPMPAATLSAQLLDTSDEKQNILLALQQSEGNRIKAAASLGISKATLWRKMKKYEIL